LLIWTTLFGAVLAWVFSGFSGLSGLAGGVFGWIFGWGMLHVIRAEVKVASEALLAKVAATSPARPMADFAPTPRPTPTPAPTALKTDDGARLVAQPDPQTVPDFPVEASLQNPEPDKPNPTAEAFSAAFGAVRNWLLGGNSIVRVGMVVLFIGLSFLASYAASAGLFPVEMRLALVAAFGAALLFFGFRTRLQRPGFGLILQGGGVATIYLTLFGFAQLIDTVPRSAVFALMILVCALGCALALLQRSQALAVTAFAGGFAVPLLLSTGSGEASSLFAYYTVLNVAIVVIARRRSWRYLNLIGFASTFGVLSLMVAFGYEPDEFLPYQVFLCVSVLIYVVTAVFFARHTDRPTPRRLGQAVDTTLLFGTALVGFGLEARLIDHLPFGAAFAALGFAGLYIGVAAFLARRQPDIQPVLREAMLAIGIVFVTLAIPLALGAKWTSAAWALEGAGAFWVGMRQARWLPRLFGLLLQGLAALVYLVGVDSSASSLVFANPVFMNGMLIALSILATAWWLRGELPHAGSRWATLYTRAEGSLGKPVFLIGFAFWWLAWATQTGWMLPTEREGGAPALITSLELQGLLAMLAFIISAWGFQILGRRTQWPVAIWPSAVSLVALVFGFAGQVSLKGHVLYFPGGLIWLIAIALHLRMLYLNDLGDDGVVAGKVVPRRLRMISHVGGVWLATAMLADCMWLGIDAAGLWETSWASVVLLASAVAVLLGLTLWATRSMSSAPTQSRWPLGQHSIAYGWTSALPIAGIVILGTLATAALASGNAAPLPFIPLLNLVDVTVALALTSLVLWHRSVLDRKLEIKGPSLLAGKPSWATFGVLAFVWINTAWLRITHQLLAVEWAPDSLFYSVIVQTGLAILWTVLALVLMVVAHRRTQRTLWLTGAGLLGLTVAKLVLVDLTNTGGGARIIAFIAVGVLMLVVGYLAPLPPRAPATAANTRQDASSEGSAA
jgi:uncharacterized membrane protein